MKMRRVVTVLAAFSALLMMQGSFAQTSSLSSDKIKNTLGTQGNGTQGKEIQTEEELDFSNMENYVLIANSSKDYPVTPGDVYRLAYAAGTSAISYLIPVDSTYTIRISNLATINGEGKTFLQLKKQVEDIVNRNYPMGGVQFVIYQTAVFQVTVKGEVSETQIKKVTALTRLSSVLKTELTDFASERNVTVVSDKGVKKSYDLYKARRNGDLSQNPYLRPGDEIIVNRYDRKVTVTGAVVRPGKYELLKGENLNELINIYGGGLRDRADASRIEVLRTLDVLDRSGRKIYLGKNAIEDNYELLNYDSVYISDYNELKTVVFFEGAVNSVTELINSQEGDSEISSATSFENDTASDTLRTSNKTAVSFEKDENYAFLVRKYKLCFTSNADLKSAYIRRGGSIIPIDLEQILYNPDFYSDQIVQEFDTLVVPFKQYFVSVAGAVRNPGRYPYIPDRTWEYYVGLAGGFDKDKNTLNSIVIVDTNNKKCRENEYILPEYTITARTNSFTYYFNKYAPVVTTVLSAISTMFTIIAVTR